MARLTLLLLPILVCSMFNLSQGKNVVLLPFTITSHARIYGMVATELAKMGHKVWLALPSAHERRKESEYPGVTIFSYNNFMNVSEDFIVRSISDTIVGHGDWSWIPSCFEEISKDYVRAMLEKNLLTFVKSLNPDLIVVDWLPFKNELTALPYELDVPFAILGPLYDAYAATIPFNPLAEAYDSVYFREQASFFEKVMVLCNIMLPLIVNTFSDRHMINRVASTKPYISTIDLMNRAEVFVIELDHIIERPKPTLPNIKFVGAISSSPAKPLQEPFRSFVERSEKSGKGIVVISFGSLVPRLKESPETKLIAVIRQFDVNVIWKTSMDSPDPQTILTSSWIPQNDLLGHNNTKVFISHCGAHSQYEALVHAVPLVCVPLFYDQFYNSERAQDKNFALTVDLEKNSVDEVYETIHEVMFGDKIRPSMEKASEIYHQLYKNPRKEAAFWLDHVMKYGGSYMRYSGQKMSWNLHVLGEFLMFMVGVVFSLVVCLTVLAVYCVCSKCGCRKQTHVKTD